MTLLMDFKSSLPAPFDSGRYPTYENTTLAQRQQIWKEYKALRRLENSVLIMNDQAKYSFIQEQLNCIYRDYISRFSSTALTREDCFV